MAASKFARAGGGDAIAIQGFSQLQAALRRIGDDVQPELRARLRKIGDQVALVAASDAPRRSGELQHSIRVSVARSSASVYSNAVYGGAINYGAWSRGRGPHIKRGSASHYMDRAVRQLSPWVYQETEAVLDWLEATFMED